MRKLGSLIRSTRPLKSFPAETADPFLFFVYHKDDYPAGNHLMEAPRRGNGQDFNPSAPYRMYHGKKIPGFPQHPHRGFETLTCTTEGLVDHTDSLGNGGRYGDGDLQWMTAGRGIVHGENFPLLNMDKGNPLRLFQIWLNLPAKNKMVEPTYVMHWHEEIPVVRSSDGLTEVVVWAGEFEGRKGLPPPPNSYGADPASHLAVQLVRIKPGGRVELPAAALPSINRALYFLEGGRVLVDGREFSDKVQLVLVPDEKIVISVPADQPESAEAHLLLLQGKPIGEPVAHHGPFVMNTREELVQTFMDYQETQFGGWPWDEDAVVFPRDKGRFATLKGKEMRPPSAPEVKADL